MAGQTKEKSVCNGEDMFTMQEVRDERKLTRIRNLPVDQIVGFPDHPYRVRDDQDMAYLVESIRANGVLTPVTVRKIGSVKNVGVEDTPRISEPLSFFEKTLFSSAPTGVSHR